MILAGDVFLQRQQAKGLRQVEQRQFFQLLIGAEQVAFEGVTEKLDGLLLQLDPDLLGAVLHPAWKEAGIGEGDGHIDSLPVQVIKPFGL